MDDLLLQDIKEKFNLTDDIRYREISLPQGKVTLAFNEVIVDRKSIAEDIIEPIIKNGQNAKNLEDLMNQVIQTPHLSLLNDPQKAVSDLLRGSVIVTSDFDQGAISCDMARFSKRSIPIPDTDPSIKGPQEGFNEFMKDNLSLIRKRIHNPNLIFEEIEVGENSKTPVGLVYMKGIASEKLISNVRSKIQNLKIDFVLETNYIEEEFQPKYTLFDLTGSYEKPDIICSKLLEGKVAILVEGSPSVAVLPNFFTENFTSPDDYYTNRLVVTGLRILRYFSFAVSILLSGFHLALTTYHHSLMPSVFLFKLAAARAGVPFPSVIEILLMTLFLELSREAGRRLPKSIGTTLSLVSTLILGETALQAGMASGGTIVIVGVYAITSLINPKLVGPIIALNIINIILSSIFGLHGFFIFFIMMVAHIASLESCGYPYMFPLGTTEQINYKTQDFLLRGKLKAISFKILKGIDEK